MKNLNMDKIKHFSLEIPTVARKLAKKERPFDSNKMFDKSGNEKIAIGKRMKKKDPNNMTRMAFYNLASKTYKEANK
tara:strand:- start:448 stop:678 length:231 start_codon:yes stop_codon:yes gene_type:complete